MKNLKFEILVDGKPRVAYVRPENVDKFKEKYQNNFPREVINAEELQHEILSKKVNGRESLKGQICPKTINNKIRNYHR